MPLSLVTGVFFPRFTFGCLTIVFVGRELYRFGYLSKNGASSKIREMGAIPLNVAELMLIMALGLAYLKYKTGSFFLRRKFVRSFSWTYYDKQWEELQKENDRASKSWAVEESLGPCHPKIMK